MLEQGYQLTYEELSRETLGLSGPQWATDPSMEHQSSVRRKWEMVEDLLGKVDPTGENSFARTRANDKVFLDPIEREE